MSVELKYKELIAEKGMKAPCPDRAVKEMETDAFRWCNEPVSDPNNFLPNFVEAEVKNKKMRQLHSDRDICGNCAISFFQTLDGAIARLEAINETRKKKMAYNCISKGRIVKTDGLVTPIVDTHFMLYEYKGVSLETKFTNVSAL